MCSKLLPYLPRQTVITLRVDGSRPPGERSGEDAVLSLFVFSLRLLGVLLRCYGQLGEHIIGRYQSPWRNLQCDVVRSHTAKNKLTEKNMVTFLVIQKPGKKKQTEAFFFYAPGVFAFVVVCHCFRCFWCGLFFVCILCGSVQTAGS